MYHTPILLREVIALIPPHTQVIVDGTFGHGGHSLAIAEAFPAAQIVGIDRDALMIAKAQERIAGIKNMTVVQWSYADIVTICHQQGIRWVDFILLDIGVNMDHFTDADRWFSIHGDAQLDMRFDRVQSLSAYDVINTYTIDTLASLFVRYADFTLAKATIIATTIAQQRKEKPIVSTKHLREIFWSCGLGKNASTILFQAIRIEVNHELDELELFLQRFDTLLNPWWRCVILSYHSIEDRIVKQQFKYAVESSQYIAITKKVVQPSRQEIKHNRAARSAKLRCVEKKASGL